MNRPLQKTSLLLSALLLLSCSDFGSSPPKDVSQDPRNPQDKATDLFREGHVPLFELTVSDSAWEWLQQHATEELYVPADLKVNGTVVGNVGIRYKGSYGNLFNCFKNGVRLPGCERLSFKLKFNQYDSTLRYSGLKRLNLHSLRADPSLLRDRLSYRLYREMGIHAPRSSHAMVAINGQPAGLYGMIENLDGRFTASRWKPEGDGNLYKEIWPVSLRPEDYIKALKTNEEIASTAGMAAFADDLPRILAEGDRALFESYTDPIQALDYLAVDLAIDNIDGYRTFYCGSNPRSVKDCGPHNFYWYEKETGGYFTLVPWDLDASFARYTWLPEMPEWNDLNYSCNHPERKGEMVLWAPVCDPYFRTLALHYQPEYFQAIDRLLNSSMAPGKAEGWLDRWSAEIAPFVEQDTLYNSSSWRGEAAILKELAIIGRWQMEQRLAQRSPERTGLRADTVNTFEGMIPSLAIAFANAWSNNNSTLSTALEQEEPLAGEASWKLSWIYRNQGAVAWSQWGSWNALWQGKGEHDLRNATELKLKISTNSDRYFNIDILSARSSIDGKNWGWEFFVSATSPEVSLPLDTLSMRYAWGGQDPVADGQPPFETLLRYATGLAFHPTQQGRGNDGIYPKGVVDSGWVKIDDIELIYR